MPGKPGSLTITVLVAPAVAGPSLRPASGLAVHVEAGPCRVLVDTGPSYNVLAHNAKTLGIDLQSTTHLILTSWSKRSLAGLPALRGSRARILAPPGPTPRLERHGLTAEIVTSPVEFCPGLTARGPLPGETGRQVLVLDALSTAHIYGCECPLQKLPPRPLVLGKECPTTTATLLDCTYNHEGPTGRACRLPAGSTLTILNPPTPRGDPEGAER